VDLTSKNWAGQVRRATEATYMYHTGGTCLNIRSAAAQLNSLSALASLPLRAFLRYNLLLQKDFRPASCFAFLGRGLIAA